MLWSRRQRTVWLFKLRPAVCGSEFRMWAVITSSFSVTLSPSTLWLNFDFLWSKWQKSFKWLLVWSWRYSISHQVPFQPINCFWFTFQLLLITTVTLSLSLLLTTFPKSKPSYDLLQYVWTRFEDPHPLTGCDTVCDMKRFTYLPSLSSRCYPPIIHSSTSSSCLLSPPTAAFLFSSSVHFIALLDPVICASVPVCARTSLCVRLLTDGACVCVRVWVSECL